MVVILFVKHRQRAHFLGILQCHVLVRSNSVGILDSLYYQSFYGFAFGIGHGAWMAEVKAQAVGAYLAPRLTDMGP